MKTYTVTVTRWVQERAVVTVEAEDEESAGSAAIVAAVDEQEEWGFCRDGKIEAIDIDEHQS